MTPVDYSPMWQVIGFILFIAMIYVYVVEPVTFWILFWLGVVLIVWWVIRKIKRDKNDPTLKI